MKKDIHPPYHDTLFVDTATGHKFVCGSSIQTKEKEMFEGKEYPVCYVTVSSASHPFFTGNKQFVDTEGRIDKFHKRYQRKQDEQKKDQQQSDEEAKKEPQKKLKKK